MSSTPNNIYYTGNPKAPLIPEKWKELPFVDPKLAEDPKYYVAPKALRDAVNIALELGLPLLLTGEPGVGKSCNGLTWNCCIYCWRMRIWLAVLMCGLTFIKCYFCGLVKTIAQKRQKPLPV